MLKSCCAALLILFSVAGQVRAEDLRVMSFNIKGLPWPVVRNKETRFPAIGQKLAELRAQGKAPHIIFLQEAFTGPISKIWKLGGYKYVAKGPSNTLCSAIEAAQSGNPDTCKVWRLLNAGIYVLSDYPILGATSVAYGNGDHCTSWDCKANKGIMYAMIQVPGIREPVHVFTTHMNAVEAAGGPSEKVWAVQRRQLVIVKDFLARTLTSVAPGPVIFGGDFNIRPKDATYADMMASIALPDMGIVCTQNFPACLIPASTDPASLYNRVDHQFAMASARTSLAPIFASQSLDKRSDGYDYSDHSALTVEYTLLNK